MEHIVDKDDNDKKLQNAKSYTKKIWEELYPNESFFLEDKTNDFEEEEKKSDTATKDVESMLLNGFDLIGSTERQATFLWQVSGIRFISDPDFIREGLHNYYKFLELKKYAPPSQVVVPT